MPQTKHTSGEKRNCENLGKLTKGKSPCFNLDTRWYLVDTRAEIYPRISQKYQDENDGIGIIYHLTGKQYTCITCCSCQHLQHNTTICVNGRKKAYAMS